MPLQSFFQTSREGLLACRTCWLPLATWSLIARGATEVDIVDELALLGARPAVPRSFGLLERVIHACCFEPMRWWVGTICRLGRGWDEAVEDQEAQKGAVCRRLLLESCAAVLKAHEMLEPKDSRTFKIIQGLKAVYKDIFLWCAFEGPVALRCLCCVSLGRLSWRRAASSRPSAASDRLRRWPKRRKHPARRPAS